MSTIGRAKKRDSFYFGYGAFFVPKAFFFFDFFFFSIFFFRIFLYLARIPDGKRFKKRYTRANDLSEKMRSTIFSTIAFRILYIQCCRHMYRVVPGNCSALVYAGRKVVCIYVETRLFLLSSVIERIYRHRRYSPAAGVGIHLNAYYINIYKCIL